jgi:hypothetical protein
VLQSVPHQNASSSLSVPMKVVVLKRTTRILPL